MPSSFPSSNQARLQKDNLIMAFNLVEKKKFAPSARVVERVSVSSSGKHTVIHISSDIDRLMHRPTKVRFLLGEGTDAGKLRIVPTSSDDSAGYSVMRKKPNGDGGASNSTISIGVYPKQIGLPVGVKFKNQSVPFTATPQYIDMNLPQVKTGK